MNDAIVIRKLSKRFGAVRAVDNVSLRIEANEIFGLLGPNGAGKTTLISMLSTLLEKTSGSAAVCGHDIALSKSRVRSSIGVVFQDPSLDIELTGRENLDFHGRLYGMDALLRNGRIAEVAALVELEEKLDMLVKTYSGGMKRRLEIARGLMHHPKVLFLDEPTLGLDPQTRRRLWDYIRDLKQEGVTIILTTHYMEEADFLCDRVAIIDAGNIKALGTPGKLKAALGGDVITIETDKPEHMKRLAARWGRVQARNHTVTIHAKQGSTLIPKLLNAARRQRVLVESVSLQKPTLEDVFIHHTGHAIREEKAAPPVPFMMRR